MNGQLAASMQVHLYIVEHDTTIYYYYETRKRYNVQWPYGYVLRLSYSVCKPVIKWLYTTTTTAMGEYTLVQSKVYIFVRKREREEQTSAYLNTHKSNTCNIQWYYTKQTSLYLSIIFFFFFGNCQFLSDYSVDRSYY